MASEAIVLSMVHRSHDDQLPRCSTFNTKYPTHTQMVQRSATHHEERMRHLRLVVMNQKAKLSRLCKTSGDYMRLNLVLSQNSTFPISAPSWPT